MVSVIERHAPGTVSARLTVPKETMLQLGAAALIRLSDETPFHGNLQYLLDNGLSQRAIGRICGKNQGFICLWAKGTKPKDEHSIRVINLWARLLRAHLDGLSLLVPSVSQLSKGSPRHQ